jgi:putative tryptophan/tyrosine transport system substrate-binding protein
MSRLIKVPTKTKVACIVMSCFILIVVCGCQHREKTFAIGIVSYVSKHSDVIEGFKAGMTELGYVEGKNIRYVYHGVVQDNQNAIDAEVKELIAEDVDVLLSVGNMAALRAIQAVEGTGRPVIFTLVSNPVECGIVKNLNHPGGNATGVANTNSLPKALEYLKTITPGLKKFYLPYNPDDEVLGFNISDVKAVAANLGVELNIHEIHSVEETVAAIKNLPEDVNAVFLLPSPTLNRRSGELCQAAIERGVPIGSRGPVDELVLITYSDNLYSIGKQTSRYAQAIRQGMPPSELPVDMSETFLTINLKTAEKIGLNVPDIILAQARIIKR